MHYPKSIQDSFSESAFIITRLCFLERFLKVKVSYTFIYLALFSMSHDLGKLINSDTLIRISSPKKKKLLGEINYDVLVSHWN